MRYKGSVWRPPSEANSLIVQATIGCSHNKCTYCYSFKEKKFRIRPVADVIADLVDEAPYAANYVRRIFIADGNALIMKTADLKQILECIRKYYPLCERVGVYAEAGDIIRKTHDELVELRKLGLGIVYLGIESGCDEVLKLVRKGATAAMMVEAGKKAKAAGILLSVTAISGLGGKKYMLEHARTTTDIINQMDPDYLGLLTLHRYPGLELNEQVARGDIELLDDSEIIYETYLILKELNLTHCMFRSNHASNKYPLGGTFPKDKDLLVGVLKKLVDDECGDIKRLYRRW